MTAFGKENMTSIVLYLYKPFLAHFIVFSSMCICVCVVGVDMLGMNLLP